MKTKKTLIVLICLLVITGGILFFNQSVFSSKDIALKDTPINTDQNGMRNYDLTFENLINKGSTNVVLGVVNGKDTLNEEREVFKVSVLEEVLGETNREEILVYADPENSLEEGQQYFLILSEVSSSVYDKDFYLQDSEFILKVLPDGNVVRLVDSFEMKYEPPFVENKYNTINELKLYTKENFTKDNDSRHQAIDHIASIQELRESSDHVVEIKALSIMNTDNGLAIVNFRITEKYKNGDLYNGENHHSIILPQKFLDSGPEFLLFLTDGPDQSFTLTTRENSIIAKTDNLYSSVIEEIKK